MRLPGVSAPVLDAQLLTVDDFDRVSPFWRDTFDLAQARAVLTQFPARSVWSPVNRECLIVGEWRNRPEVASIVGSTAVRSRRTLLREAASQAQALGLEAIVTIEWMEQEAPEFYSSAGYRQLDAVVPFELPAVPSGEARSAILPIEIIEARRLDHIEKLIDVDHAAFDWLWINSQVEFEQYGRSESVELWGHFDGGALASYVGITLHGNWGHIDRLAVHPAWQRQGLGEVLTRFAIDRLRGNGATTVGLSTQIGNWQSQRLYARLGFRRSSANIYHVYGHRFGNL